MESDPIDFFAKGQLADLDTYSDRNFIVDNASKLKERFINGTIVDKIGQAQREGSTIRAGLYATAGVVSDLVPTTPLQGTMFVLSGVGGKGLGLLGTAAKTEFPLLGRSLFGTTKSLTYDISKWGEYGLPSDGYFVRTLRIDEYRALKAGRDFNFGGASVDGYQNGMGFIGSAAEVRSINTVTGYREALQLGYNPNYVMEFQLRDPVGLQNVIKAPYIEFVPDGKTGAGFSEWNYPAINSTNIINPRVRVLK